MQTRTEPFGQAIFSVAHHKRLVVTHKIAGQDLRIVADSWKLENAQERQISLTLRYRAQEQLLFEGFINWLIANSTARSDNLALQVKLFCPSRYYEASVPFRQLYSDLEQIRDAATSIISAYQREPAIDYCELEIADLSLCVELIQESPDSVDRDVEISLVFSANRSTTAESLSKCLNSGGNITNGEILTNLLEAITKMFQI